MVTCTECGPIILVIPGYGGLWFIFHRVFCLWILPRLCTSFDDNSLVSTHRTISITSPLDCQRTRLVCGRAWKTTLGYRRCLTHFYGHIFSVSESSLVFANGFYSILFSLG